MNLFAVYSGLAPDQFYPAFSRTAFGGLNYIKRKDTKKKIQIGNSSKYY